MAAILKGQSGQPIGFEVKPTINGDAVATEFDAGVGRTWQDVTGFRSAGVTYTNNTGRDIQLGITTNTPPIGNGTITIGGIPLIILAGNIQGGDAAVTGSFNVPENSTYLLSLSSGATLISWKELR